MLPCLTPALILLSVVFVHSSDPSCRIGTYSECDAAPFVPGHSLVGAGFDVVTQERRTAHVIDVKTYQGYGGSCILCSNPLQNDMYQKLPSSVADWSASSQCNNGIISSYHNSISSLNKAYTTQDINDWMFGLKMKKGFFSNFDVGGTRSAAYKFVSQKSKEDRYTYSLHTVTCKHYGFILSKSPALSEEFKKHLEILPRHYNNSTIKEYIKLIHTYGTHYFRTVHLGGRLRRVSASRSCLSTLNGLSSSEAHSCLSLGVAVGLGKMKILSVQRSCIGALNNHDFLAGHHSGLHQHHTEVSGGDGWLGEFSISKDDSIAYKNWLMSLNEHPDVVSYSLRPLYQLVSNQRQKAGVKAAIERYLENHAVKKSPQEPHCEGNTPNLSSNCCPEQASRGTLSVTIIRGWDLYGDVIGKTDGYAKMHFGPISHKTEMIQSNEPWWDAEFNLGKVDTTQLLTIEVWDQDPKYDDLLIKCERFLSQGSHTFTCSSKLGKVEVKYTMSCDPYLTGEQCTKYKPSP